MNKLITTQFVKPSPKEELNGVIGLSIEEIAVSLGVEASDLRRRMKGDRGRGNKSIFNELQEENFNCLAIARSNETNGLEYESYVMDVEAAKYVVARSNSKIGNKYIAYLVKLDTAFQKMSDPLDAIAVMIEQMRENRNRITKQTEQIEGIHSIQKILTDDLADTKVTDTIVQEWEDIIKEVQRATNNVKTGSMLKRRIKEWAWPGRSISGRKFTDVPRSKAVEITTKLEHLADIIINKYRDKQFKTFYS